MKNKKKEQAKEKIIKTPKVTLTSYTLKATISTGQYSNIQPEITVMASSIEAAHDLVIPYIDRLFREYAHVYDNPIGLSPMNNPKPVVKTEPVSPKVETKVETKEVEPKPAEKPVEDLTAPYAKAKKAILSCNSVEALNLVNNQIEKSTKLSESEKKALSIYLKQKTDEING